MVCKFCVFKKCISDDSFPHICIVLDMCIYMCVTCTWVVNTLGDSADEMSYVDLLLNPERFTGYSGPSALRIWESIYKENCFRYMKCTLYIHYSCTCILTAWTSLYKYAGQSILQLHYPLNHHLSKVHVHLFY